jgi:tRNA-dihydrouridine synthase
MMAAFHACVRRQQPLRITGVQIATNQIGEGVRAGIKAAEAGADFLDLNCGEGRGSEVWCG